MKDRSCFRVSGSWPTFYICDFLWIGRSPCSRLPMSEVLYFRLKERAVLQFQFQPVFCQSREHRVQSLEQFSDSGGEDMIQVAEQDAEHFLAESGLHKSLEGGGCVTQSECYSFVLVQAKWRGEGSLVLVFRVHQQTFHMIRITRIRYGFWRFLK